MINRFRITPLQSPRIRPVLVGGAWFFILASLGHLVWMTALKVADPSADAAIFQTTAGDSAVGLTYNGWFGLVQSCAQLGLISVAALATVLPVQRWRRVGHVVLVSWSALWLVNLLSITSSDMRLDTLSQTTVLSALFACTLGRAFLGWTPRSRRLAPVEADDELAEIFGSPAPASAPLPVPEQKKLARWRDRLSGLLTEKLQSVGQILRRTAGSLRMTVLDTWTKLRPKAAQRARAAAGQAQAGAARAADKAARAGQRLADRLKAPTAADQGRHCRR